MTHKFRGGAENLIKGAFHIPFDLTLACRRTQALVKRYRSLPMSLVDACLVCLAEELGTARIMTLDSDFSFYRWGKNKPFFNLIPLS